MLSNKKHRQTNFELLRIIAMFMIVMHHSLIHGVLTVSKTTLVSVGNPLSLSLFSSFTFLGKVGVYLFVLITGYFMIDSQISLSKVVRLWLPVFFWSVVLTLICGSVVHQLTIKAILESLFPILLSKYWFMTTYVFMYLLIPFMNKMLLNLNRGQALALATIGIVILIPGSFVYGHLMSSWLIKFCIAYCLGALIRRYKLLGQERVILAGKRLLIISLLVDLLASFSCSYLAFRLHSITFITYIKSIVAQGITVFSFLTALGLFIVIGAKKVSYNKLINSVAATTFGIYLIHDNVYMEQLLWVKILHMKAWATQSVTAIFYVVLVCCVVFAICSLLEFIRKMVFHNFESRLATWVSALATRLVANGKQRLVK